MTRPVLARLLQAVELPAMRHFPAIFRILKPRQKPFALVLAPLVIVWILENRVGERQGWTALLLYLPQHPYALYPLAFLIFGVLRSRRLWVEAGAIGLCFWAVCLLGFRFSMPLSDQKSSTIRLMTYNIERGAHGTDALEHAIVAQKADIVCLQESQGFVRAGSFRTGAELAARWVGWSASESGDVMTLSRFSLVSSRNYPARGTRRILETTLQTPGGLVRILNVHIATSFATQSALQTGKTRARAANRERCQTRGAGAHGANRAASPRD